MNVYKYLLSLMLLIWFPTTGFASDSILFSGYYKSFFTAIDPVDFKGQTSVDQPLTGTVINRIRFKAFYNPQKWLSLSVAYNPYFQVQDNSSFSNQLNNLSIKTFKYRVFDLDSRIYPDEDDVIGNFGFYQNLDRALIVFSIPKADIRIGRQSIAWGSAHIINPTDILAPFSLGTLDAEERAGVDAIQVLIPIGFMGELNLGSVWGKDFEIKRSAFFSKFKYNILKSDVSILLLDFQENLLIGFDLAHNIGGAGAWIEAAQVMAGLFENKKNDEMSDYFRISIGMNYNFIGKIYAFAEYHYNEAGSIDPGEYLSNLFKTAYTDGSVYLMGRHYLGVGLNYQVKPLITLSGQSLFNLPDRSTFLSVQAEYNIAQDIYLSLGAFAGIGKRPDMMNMSFNSEFGVYQNMYFTSFRIYF